MTSTPAAATRHQFRFRSAPGKRNIINLDGHDIAAKLAGVQIVSDPVAGTRVALEVHPNALDDVEFDGVAVVEINAYSDDPGPAAATFLGALDAELVEKAMLARTDLDADPYGGTRALLATLIDMANGEWSQ